MAFFISLLKRIFSVDDEDRSSNLKASPTRQSNSSTGVYRDPSLYTTALDRDPELYSRRNAPPTSQSNSSTGVDDEDRSSILNAPPSRQSNSRSSILDAPPTRQSNSGSSIPDAPPTRQSNSSTGVYRDALLYGTAGLDSDTQLFSKCDPPRTSQSNSGVTNSIFRTRDESYPNQETSTHSVSGTYTSKQASGGNSVASPGLYRNVTVESPKPPPISTKPTISVASSCSLNPQSKNAYIWVEKDASSAYVFPREIKSLIEKDIVPGVLKMPLTKSSYKDYFHALLYAEDCYLEMWDGFEMKNVKVQLHEATIYTRRGKNTILKNGEDKDEKFLVAFELDKIHERRPFLISRDFVSLQPTKQTIKPFQGVLYRVVKSNLVLAELGQEFFSRHHPDDTYDVKFSFNRVCLKRAHQAIAAASESLLNNLLFPNITQKHEFPSSSQYNYQKEPLVVGQIVRLQGLPPYLVEGPLAVERENLSKTGEVVVEAIIRILRADPSKKILLCAPMNRTCDLLMRGLKKEIAESEMFRANAAFREDVPEDILSSCLYTNTGDTECFACPEFAKLKEYKVISTTFMSSYRLYGEGINGGYFSHIFVVDASSATEPEAMVPLANFVTAETVVVVTGAPGNRSSWIRSKIARENGLVTSYFERLRDSTMYRGLDAKLIVQLEDTEKGMY